MAKVLAHSHELGQSGLSVFGAAGLAARLEAFGQAGVGLFVERKLKHPAVVAIAERARQMFE